MKKNLKTEEAENANIALKDPGVRLKFLAVDDYMKSIRLIKEVSTFIDGQVDSINTLVKEYNKDYLSLIASPEYKAAKEKKEKGEKELTVKEVELLETKPPVTSEFNRLRGPDDFIAKVNKIRESVLKNVETNFVKDAKVFKQVTENTTSNNQLILFELLFKQ